MFIQTQDTPNPNTLKFVPGTIVLAKGHKQYNKDDDCTDSKLAEQLFTIKGIRAIFFGNDFISITKNDNIHWKKLKISILSYLVDHFVSGQPVIDKIFIDNHQEIPNSKIELEIIKLLNTKIRPAVAQDGGDIIYRKFENGIVFLELHGACQGCPSSTITLKQGIENMLKHYLREVKSVESI